METSTIIFALLLALGCVRFFYVVISEEMARGPRQEYGEEDF
jgi:hypothetical protein